MANRSAAGSGLVDRRTVLQAAAALATAAPGLMREGHAAARPPVVIDAQVHAYAERAMLMGGACTKAYGWSPKKA